MSKNRHIKITPTESQLELIQKGDSIRFGPVKNHSNTWLFIPYWFEDCKDGTMVMHELGYLPDEAISLNTHYKKSEIGKIQDDSDDCYADYEKKNRVDRHPDMGYFNEFEDQHTVITYCLSYIDNLDIDRINFLLKKHGEPFEIQHGRISMLNRIHTV